MNMNFSNNVVWVTGASSGIDKALTTQLSKKGAKIILSSRNEEELIKLQQALSLSDNNSLVLPLDLAQHDTLTEKVEKAITHFGSVDCMIHNGGISQRSLASETSLAVDKKIIDINFWGAVILTKALLPHMIQQNFGQFIVISSLTGKFGSKLRSSYAASKHALHGYFDSLRYDHWQNGIQVLLVCPGFIKTNISKNALKGDGSLNSKMDEAQNNGISAEACAEKIIKAAEKNKEEIVVGGKEVLSVYIKRFFPSLLSNMMKKMEVK